MDATLDIDSIITAIGEVAEVGGVADSIFAHPANITALRLLKDTAGRPLLQPDMQAAGAERIAGATLYATPALSAGTVVVAQSRFIVLAFRRDASVDFSADALFTKDGVAARVTMRVDWGVADPAAFHVIKPA